MRKTIVLLLISIQCFSQDTLKIVKENKDTALIITTTTTKTASVTYTQSSVVIVNRPYQPPVVVPPVDSTPIPFTGYALVYSTGYDKTSDLDPFGHNQIGNGSLSTTIFKTGPGSFKAVPANVSSGIRSEVQYDSPQTPLEGAVEYDVMYQTIFKDNGHSLQWHPSTSGGSASPGLWHVNGVFDVVNWKGGTNTHHNTGFKIQANVWYHIRTEYKFGSNGYFRFYIDGNLIPGGSWTGQVGDGSAPYLKIGTNQWVSASSVVYYDNLQIFKKQ